VAQSTVTYDGHPAGSLPLDGTEELPAWQGGAARKLIGPHLRHLRLNPSSVLAAGSDQSGATVLSDSYEIHRVGTVVAGNDGVKFAAQAAGIIGAPRVVRCDEAAATDLLLYPPLGGKLNGLAANTSMTIPRGTAAYLLNISTTDWITVP
jgi:hypothetical protein